MNVSTEGKRAIRMIGQTVAGAHERGDRMLLLLPGGSAAALIEPLFGELVAYQDELTVSLTDERYVDVASLDSNWHTIAALQSALPRATFVPVLTGASRVEDCARFNDLFADFAHDSHATIIMLLGMGADGHTSGIKPHTVAAESQDFVCDYTGPDYERITTTNMACPAVDLSVIYAQGAGKAAVVADFARDDISSLVMPAQFVKLSKAYALFYDS